MTDPRNHPPQHGFLAQLRADGASFALAGTFAAIALLVAADLVTDARAGARAAHLAIELGVFAFAAAGLAAMIRQLRSARRLTGELQGRLAAAREDAARWREEAQQHLAGLSALIDRQFARWELSDAEREVALLLLKGLSHKEVAAARGTSERTARQQSLAVYRKAGLAGRAELSAFFLEDLLAPPARDAEGTRAAAPVASRPL